MTKSWIIEAKERAEKATEGPWRTREDMGCAASVDDLDGGVVAQAQQRTSSAVDPLQTDRIANAAFIAAARTDVPRLASALLDAVEALEKLTANPEAIDVCPHCGTVEFTGGDRTDQRAHFNECPVPSARRVLQRILEPKEG
jgi:hypothetical protein